VLPDTSQTWTIQDTAEGNATTIGATEYAITANIDYTPTAKKVIKSGATHTVQLNGTFSTTNSYLSPVIDMERCSVITISNRINTPTSGTVANYYAETDSERGSALAKYLTKTVKLTDAADAIKIYMDINRPSFTTVQVYHKVGSVDSTFDDIAWTEMVTTVPFSDDGLYKEVVFDFDSAASPFTMFAVKVVFTSTSTAAVPSIKKFRAIALT
jgi:Zn-dependent alcohol dehydrogenase